MSTGRIVRFCRSRPSFINDIEWGFGSSSKSCESCGSYDFSHPRFAGLRAQNDRLLSEQGHFHFGDAVVCRARLTPRCPVGKAAGTFGLSAAALVRGWVCEKILICCVPIPCAIRLNTAEIDPCGHQKAPAAYAASA
jgi:hypothetical protein